MSIFIPKMINYLHKRIYKIILLLGRKIIYSKENLSKKSKLLLKSKN